MSFKKTLLFGERKRPREEEEEDEVEQEELRDPFLEEEDDDEKGMALQRVAPLAHQPLREQQLHPTLKEAAKCEEEYVVENAKAFEVWKFTVEICGRQKEKETFLGLVIQNVQKKLDVRVICGANEVMEDCRFYWHRHDKGYPVLSCPIYNFVGAERLECDCGQQQKQAEVEDDTDPLGLAKDENWHWIFETFNIGEVWEFHFVAKPSGAKFEGKFRIAQKWTDWAGDEACLEEVRFRDGEQWVAGYFLHFPNSNLELVDAELFLPKADDNANSTNQYFQNVDTDSIKPCDRLRTPGEPAPALKEAKECEAKSVITVAQKNEVWKFTAEHQATKKKETFLGLVVGKVEKELHVRPICGSAEVMNDRPIADTNSPALAFPFHSYQHIGAEKVE